MKNDLQKFTINPIVKTAIDPELKLAEDVFELCRRVRFIPETIVQIGAANAGDFEFMPFIERGSKAILLEPHPEFYKILKEKWGGINNISIFECGIYNKVGKFKFYEKWAATCLEECSKNANYLPDDQVFDENEVFFANCCLFSGFDNGEIDLLLVDTNGAEWYVLEELKSRPKIICLETHYIYRNYKTLFIEKIYAWMTLNNYIIYAKNESDTVFMRIK